MAVTSGRVPWHAGFFASLYRHVLASQFTPAQTRAQAALVRRVLRLRPGERALDVPCGMGRLTIPLAQAGVRMTGADVTGAYLRIARREARRLGLAVRFVQADMRDLPFDRAFDAAFNWFGSFGYFSERDNLRVLRSALAALRPGGRYLVEGLNRAWLRDHFLATDERVIGGVRVRNRRRWSRDGRRLIDWWSMSDGRREERHRISLRIYGGAELRDLLRAAGFRDIRLYGHAPTGPLTRGKARLIAVGVRPA